MLVLDPERAAGVIEECTEGRPDLVALFEALCEEWPHSRDPKANREALAADFYRIMRALQG